MIHKNKETQRRLAKLCHKSGQYRRMSFTFGRVYYDDFSDNEKEHRFKNEGMGRSFKSLKKQGNRKIRYYKGDLKNGKHCYKVFNAKWEYY